MYNSTPNKKVSKLVTVCVFEFYIYMIIKEDAELKIKQNL